MTEPGLKERRILITGAGSGIGRTLAERVISAGALVTLVDLRGDSIADLAQEENCEAHEMDVSAPEGWAALPHYGMGWDFIALNAGIMTAPPDAPRKASDLLAMDLDRYQQVMRVNVDGVLHGVRRFASELAPSGAIVVTASAAGLVGYPGDVAYSMSKHAVVALVRGLAPHFGRKKLDQRILAICPGGVRTGIVPAAFKDTPMMEPSVIADDIIDLWFNGENGEVRARMRPEIPGKNIEEPELPPWW